MKVKIQKLHPDSVIPSYAKTGDAGLDLTSVGITQNEKYIEHTTGWAIEIPEGYVGLVFPRSSITTKGLILKNSVGVIDSGYRGEIRIRFQDLEVPYADEYKVGERIAQLVIVPIPYIDLVEVDNLTDTERGVTGYGSSGK